MGLQHWAFVKTQSTASDPPLLQDQPFSCITHSPQNQLCPGATFPAPGAHQPSPPLLRGPLGTATAGTCSGASSRSGHWPSLLLEKPPPAMCHLFLGTSRLPPSLLPMPPAAGTPHHPAKDGDKLCRSHPEVPASQWGVPPAPRVTRAMGGYRAPALATTMPLRPLDARPLECGEAAGGPSSRDL